MRAQSNGAPVQCAATRTHKTKSTDSEDTRRPAASLCTHPWLQPPPLDCSERGDLAGLNCCIRRTNPSLRFYGLQNLPESESDRARSPGNGSDRGGRPVRELGVGSSNNWVTSRETAERALVPRRTGSEDTKTAAIAWIRGWESAFRRVPNATGSRF